MDEYEAKYLERIRILEENIRFHKHEIWDMENEIKKEQKWARECREAELRGAKPPLLSDWGSQAEAAYKRVDDLEEKVLRNERGLQSSRAELREIQSQLERLYGYDFGNYEEPDAFPSFSEMGADLKDFLNKVKESFKPKTFRDALIISFAYALVTVVVLQISEALYLGSLAGLLIAVAGPIIYAVIVSKKLFSPGESKKGAKAFIAYGLGLFITISTMFELSAALVIRTAVLCLVVSLILERMTGAKG